MSYNSSAPEDTPEHSPRDEPLAAERGTPHENRDGAPALPLSDVDGHSPSDARYAAAPPPPSSLGRPTYASDADEYGDVPASLELAYTASDLGLSPGAYDRAIPYGDVARKRRSHSGMRARRIGRELVETVILALLIFFAVKAVVQNFRVEGSSMEPSLHTEQYLLVNKALYFRVNMDKVHDVLPFIAGDNGQKRHLFRAPRRGDVIVFKYPGDPSRDFIKRVIGVPGDTVEVHDGTVFVNGSPLTENYIKERPNYTYAPKTVPVGSYWVLGDNRNNSFDSHAWASSCTAFQQCDFVPEENIIGQAWVSYWPFDTLGFVNNKIVKPSAP
jgi:signal peptidase I